MAGGPSCKVTEQLKPPPSRSKRPTQSGRRCRDSGGGTIRRHGACLMSTPWDPSAPASCYIGGPSGRAHGWVSGADVLW